MPKNKKTYYAIAKPIVYKFPANEYDEMCILCGINDADFDDVYCRDCMYS